MKDSLRKKAALDFQVNYDICDGCGLCVAVCPVLCLYVGFNEILHVDHDACIRCGICLPVCPAGALSLVKKEKEQTTIAS